MSWNIGAIRGVSPALRRADAPDRYRPPRTNAMERMEMGDAPFNPAHRNPILAQQMNTAERMESGASPPHPAHRNPTEEEKAAQEERRNSPRPPQKRRPQRLRFNEGMNRTNSFNPNDTPEAISRPRVRGVEQPVIPVSRSISRPSLSTLAAAGSGAGEENSPTFRSISDDDNGDDDSHGDEDVIRPRYTSPRTLREHLEIIEAGNEEIARNRSPASPDPGWHGGRWNNLLSLGRRTRRTKRSTKRRTKRKTKRSTKRRTRRRRSA